MGKIRHRWGSALAAGLLLSSAPAPAARLERVAPAGPAALDSLAGGAVEAALVSRAREKRRLGRARSKLAPRLRALLAPAGVASRRSALRAGPAPRAAGSDGGRVSVSLKLTSTSARVLAALARKGLAFEIVNHDFRLVQGTIATDRLESLAALAAVAGVRAVEPGRLRIGSVTTEGDVAARADLVRAAGHDGSGVVVGVISDGIDSLAAAEATGDLARVTVPADPRCRPGSGDEGTAILEIVRDIAPGAELLFSEGFSSDLAFIDSVNCLRDAGARVIVDDLGFGTEPFYEDGPVALTVQAAARAGVSYHSAAGNEAGEHLEQLFQPSSGSDLHDFRGDPPDNTNDLMVGAFDSVLCVLQWNDPFGRSANDYDLYLLDEFLDVIDGSEGVQSGDGDPIEIVEAFNPTSSPEVAKVIIIRYDGDERLLKLLCFGAEALEYTTSTGSVVGHPAVAEVVAVGAVDVADPGLDTVRPFSSRGPSTIFFPAFVRRAKPDLVAFDGVSISNAGGFPACPPRCAFSGTSAAAPHSAAVAALLLGKNPLLAGAEIRSALTAAAVDIGQPGHDDLAGFGRLDAFAAAARVPPAECLSSSACDDGDPCNGLESCGPSGCVAGAPLRCDDRDACNGLERCEPAVGCVAGTALTCDDGNPCTVESCDSLAGCTSTPGRDGSPCGDGTVCNGAEVCQAGACVAGAPLDCDDRESCTADACDPVTGCTHVPRVDFDGITCRLDAGLAALAGAGAGELSGGVRRRLTAGFEEARLKVGSARTASATGSRRRERRRLREADRILGRLVTVVRVARRGERMPGELADLLRDLLRGARAALAERLRR